MFSLNNFLHIASFNSKVPDVGVYFVNPLFIDSIAAVFMWSGVSKSGSPALNPITSIPSDRSCFTLAVMDNVADGLRFFTSCDNGMLKLSSSFELAYGNAVFYRSSYGNSTTLVPVLIIISGVI